MPLSLTVKPGDQIYVGGQKLEVIEIEPTVRMRVRTPSGKIVTVTDLADVEVMPNVKVGLGKIQSGGLARLVVLAPKEVKVLRERLVDSSGKPNGSLPEAI